MTDETIEPTGDGSETITIRKDFGLFMARLYEQSARDVQWTTNCVIENLTARADRAETTLAWVREGIGRLLDGDYMPTSAAIERAMYPSWEFIERLRAERALP